MTKELPAQIDSTDPAWPSRLQIQHLDIEKLVPSPTNPRKHFDQAKLKELENSMREQGFTLSVMLVRPLGARELVIEGDESVAAMHFIDEILPNGEKHSLGTAGNRKEAEAMVEKLRDRFEIVCGECRWRAAKAAGIHEVPCIVRKLTDQEVLILQLIENLQRTDLSPIEEADGYALVLAQKDEKGNPLYTIEKLAKEIGKDPHVVYRKMRLARLEPGCEIRAALEKGTLPIITAVILAGIPDPKMRAQAAKEVLFPQHEEGPLSRQRTQMLIDEKYRRDLEKAGFDVADKELLSVELDEAGERCAGGACKDCPFRIGNMKKLDPNIPKEQKNDVCTNLGCFERKRQAEWARWQATETDPEKKRRALTEKECNDLFRYGYFQSSALVDLGEHPDSRDLRPGEQSPGTWRKLVKGAGVEVLVARDKDGKTRELVDREQARRAAVKINKVKALRPIEPEKAKSEEQLELEDAAEKAEALRTRFLNDAIIGEIMTAIERAPCEPENFWQMLLRFLTETLDPDDAQVELGMRRGWKEDEEYWETGEWNKKVASLTAAEARSAMIELMVRNLYEREEWAGIWATLYGLKAAKLRAEAEKAWKAKVKEQEIAQKEMAQGIEWRAPMPESPDWDDNGNATRVGVVELVFPQRSATEVRIRIASGDGEFWYGGHDLLIPNPVKGEPRVLDETMPTLAAKPRKTMLLAVVDEAYWVLEFLRKKKSATKVIEQMSAYIQTLLNLAETEAGKTTKNAKSAKKGGK